MHGFCVNNSLLFLTGDMKRKPIGSESSFISCAIRHASKDPTNQRTRMLRTMQHAIMFAKVGKVANIPLPLTLCLGLTTERCTNSGEWTSNTKLGTSK